MSDVRPFRAHFYNQNIVGPLERVVVPPFDVISKKEKNFFFKKSPFNFARVILGKNQGDGYKAVSQRLQKWKEKKVLILDSEPHYYVWEQSFLHGKQCLKRYSIAAIVAISDYKKKKILPHEKTLLAPKLDRLKLIRACQANLSPVFMMYDDPRYYLERKIIPKLKAPFLRFQDEEGVIFRIWKVDDFLLSNLIQKEFKKRKLYIVDGHHRFGASLMLSDLERKNKDHPCHYAMSVITNMQSKSLVVYPIYRLLKRTDKFNKEQYLTALSKHFIIRKRKGVSSLKRSQWGILFRNDPSYYEVSLPREKRKTVIKTMKGHALVKDLDVSILQQVVVPQNLLEEIRYTRGMGNRLKEEILALKKGKYEALWMVKAPSVQELKQIANVSEVMPAKSTFFYPKVFAGLLIRSFS